MRNVIIFVKIIFLGVFLVFFCAGSWALASSKASDVLLCCRSMKMKTWKTSITAAYDINSIKNNFQPDQYECCLLWAWGWLKRKGALGNRGVKTGSVTSYFHQVNTESLKFNSIWQDVCQPCAALPCRGNLWILRDVFTRTGPPEWWVS